MTFDALILGLALAGAPTAIVDSAVGVPGLHPFELLDAGTELTVATGARVRIAYFASCVHETISGGRLRVGVTASLVNGAKVERVTTRCAVPTGVTGLAGAPAALMLRDSAARDRIDLILRLGTTAPVLIGEPGSRVELKQLGMDTSSYRLRLKDRTLSLAESGIYLEPGATYRVCSGDGCRTVHVDAAAGSDAGTILERTIRIAR